MQVEAPSSARVSDPSPHATHTALHVQGCRRRGQASLEEKRLAGISRLGSNSRPCARVLQMAAGGGGSSIAQPLHRDIPTLRHCLPGAVITVRAPGTGQTANVVVPPNASLLQHAIPSLADEAVGRACSSSTSLWLARGLHTRCWRMAAAVQHGGLTTCPPPPTYPSHTHHHPHTAAQSPGSAQHLGWARTG